MIIYFTGEQYVTRYPDLKAAGADPLQHYLMHGRKEGREVAFPEGWTAEGYLNHPFNADIKNDPFWGSRPELHWLMDGAEHHRPYTTPQPTPGHWKPPTASGELCRLPGPFFMSGLKTPGGLLLGTYRRAKLYLWNGSFTEQIIEGMPETTESVYMLYNCPDGHPIFSTECPAGIGKHIDGNRWKWSPLRSEPESVSFDILPFQGGLSLFTADKAWGRRQRIYLADINGLNWSPWKDFEGHFLGSCTDGSNYYLIGERNNAPCIIDHNGKQIMNDLSYKDQIINYASVKDGLFTLGLNNIADLISDGTRRNGYVTYFDGQHHIAGIDCKPPWIMQTEAVPEGRFAIASIWRESGYPNPELVWSRDGRTGWKKIADLPIPSVQTVEIADGGAYWYGGQYGQYAAAGFHKL